MSLGTPSIAVFDESSLARVRIEITEGVGTENPSHFEIQRFDGSWVTISTIENTAADPDITYDYTAPRMVESAYRARSINVLYEDVYSDLYDPVSEYSSGAAVFVFSDGNEWLKSVDDPSLNMAVCRAVEGLEVLVSQSDQNVAVYYSTDRSDPVVVANTAQLESYEELGFFFENTADWEQFEAIRASGSVVLLQTCFPPCTLGPGGYEPLYASIYSSSGPCPGGAQEQFYLRFTSPRQLTRYRLGNSGRQARLAKLPAVQVAAPV